MAYELNALTGKFDKVKGFGELDARYVEVAGDTMTGELIISPTGANSLDAQKNITLKSGQKLIFDGA